MAAMLIAMSHRSAALCSAAGVRARPGGKPQQVQGPTAIGHPSHIERCANGPLGVAEGRTSLRRPDRSKLAREILNGQDNIFEFLIDAPTNSARMN